MQGAGGSGMALNVPHPHASGRQIAGGGPPSVSAMCRHAAHGSPPGSAAGGAVEVRVGTANSLAGRYAAALFDLAESDRSLDKVMDALARLETALAESPELAALIGDRLLSRAEIGAGLAAVAKTMKLPTLVANFLGVLAANGRSALLPDVIRAYRERLASHRGEATAKVIAAHRLTAAQEKALAAKLRARTGRDMALDVTVDPSILGGLVVRIGSEQIDTSVKTRLERLGARMKGLN